MIGVYEEKQKKKQMYLYLWETKVSTQYVPTKSITHLHKKSQQDNKS